MKASDWHTMSRIAKSDCLELQIFKTIDSTDMARRNLIYLDK